jgi:hypothetical protein
LDLAGKLARRIGCGCAEWKTSSGQRSTLAGAECSGAQAVVAEGGAPGHDQATGEVAVRIAVILRVAGRRGRIAARCARVARRRGIGEN